MRGLVLVLSRLLARLTVITEGSMPSDAKHIQLIVKLAISEALTDLLK